MEWTESIGKAVRYIEDNITENISSDEVAHHVGISSFYFQKGFSMLCGLSVAEYIRNRRLALAAGELASSDKKNHRCGDEIWL
jgi:AraC family transcriptional regulator